MAEYRYPSDLELNDNLYLIDTSVWVDITCQISDLKESPLTRKFSGIQDVSVEEIIARIFSKVGQYKLYVSKDIKKEYIEAFRKGKENLKGVSIDAQNIVYRYMCSLDEDDTYLVSSNKYLLKRDIEGKENNTEDKKRNGKEIKGDPYSGDRRIFVSGRSRYIGNIVTQDWDDYKALRKQLLDKYNPIIYKCTEDKVGIFNGLQLKGDRLTEPRKIKEYYKPLARRLLEYFKKLFR